MMNKISFRKKGKSMDKTMKIIELLQENSRLTEKQIVVALGLTEEEVRNTIKELEDKK